MIPSKRKLYAWATFSTAGVFALLSSALVGDGDGGISALPPAVAKKLVRASDWQACLSGPSPAVCFAGAGQALPIIGPHAVTLFSKIIVTIALISYAGEDWSCRAPQFYSDA